jgi:hypothetical protein
MSTGLSPPALPPPPANSPIPPIPLRRTRRVLRWLFLLTALILACFAAVEVERISRATQSLKEARQINSVAYTDPIKAAVAQKLEAAKGLFQASLLVVAVLWGLVIAKKDEHKLLLTDLPEFGMFLLANIWFVASCYSYTGYLDAMADVHSRAPKYVEPADLRIMDFRSPLINGFYAIQQSLWVYGVVTAAMTLFSAHLLKEQP